LNEVFQTGRETSGCSKTDEHHICLPVVFEIKLIERLVFVSFSLSSIRLQGNIRGFTDGQMDGHTLKPRFNKSEGTKDLFFITGVLLLQGIFIILSTSEGLEITFFIAGILLLKGSL
jgi:hypothetical protein